MVSFASIVAPSSTVKRISFPALSAEIVVASLWKLPLASAGFSLLVHDEVV